MKLYNLYQEVIFEETQKKLHLLSEVISDGGIKAAIQGKYNVKIRYKDDDGTKTQRYIQIYTLGITKAGNQAIRAFQIGGPTNSPSTENIWKTFRVDRIESIEPTNMKWYNPVSNSRSDIPKYIEDGDKEFSSIIMQVDPETFKQRSNVQQTPKTVEPTISNRVTTPKRPEKEPIVNKSEVPRINKQVRPNEPVSTEPEIGDNEEELEKDIYGNTTTS